MIGDLIKLPENGGSPERGPKQVAIYGKRRFWSSRWFRIFAAACLAGIIACPVVLYYVLKPYQELAQTFDLAQLDEVETPSIILDRNGAEIGRIYVQDRRPVEIEEIPHHVVQALVAAEDSRFFSHHGVDYMGMARAALRNLKAGGKKKQGASTITQQLARQTFQMMDKTMARKFTEIFVAKRIEEHRSKSEILELYLNRIYFGSGFYGINAAAEGYFGKPVSEITIDEGAILCGLIKLPEVLSPFKNPDRSRGQRDYVLDRMGDEGMLSSAEVATFKAEPLRVVSNQGDPRSSYEYEEIRQRVIEELGFENAASGGFRIYTTIDMRVQAAAQSSLLSHLASIEARPEFLKHEVKPGEKHQTYAEYERQLANYPAEKSRNPNAKPPKPEYLQGALLMIDNTTGGILAVVGGRNFRHSKYNRAYSSKRAPGTAFAPFVFAAAYADGKLFPGTRLEDSPIDNRRVMIGGLTGILGEYGTEDPGSKWSMSEITAREALSLGKNAATVRMGEAVGLDPIKSIARKAGIESVIKDYPASYLGSSGLRLSELCMAYTIFPNKGVRPQELLLLTKIQDSEGAIVYSNRAATSTPLRVLNEVASYQVHSCLNEALRGGTGANARRYGLKGELGGGKTGTHHNYTDLWFIGYNSEVTCGVWTGFDLPRTVYDGAFGKDLALPIWVNAMNAAAASRTPTRIDPPADAKHVKLCKVTGLLATDGCYEEIQNPNSGEVQYVSMAYEEYIQPNTQLPGYCDLHSKDTPMISAVAHQPEPKREEPRRRVRVANAEPVIPKAAIILGDDPYESLRPVMKAQIPSDGDGTKVMKATPVRVLNQFGDEDSRIELDPPPRIEIE